MSAELLSGSFPEGWTLTKLGDCVEFSPKISKEFLDSGDEVSFVPMPKVMEVSGRIDLDETISVAEGKRRNLTYFEDGDVIFAKITPCMENGKIARPSGLVNGAAFGSSEFHVLRPNELIDGSFLRLFLVHDDFRSDAERAMTGAVGQRRVPRKYLESYEFALPGPLEQKRIVEILEEQLSRLDSALDSVHAIRRLAARFRRSILHAGFTGTLIGHDPSSGTIPEGWDKRLLKHCLEKLKSGKYVERGWSPQCLSHPAENTWGVLKTTSVQMGGYLPEYNKELPMDLEPKVGLEVNDGDFLMTTTGPRNRCGVICHVSTTPERLIFSGKMLRFRADENLILASWLMNLLMSPTYQKVLDKLKVGTSDSSVSIGNNQILDLEIPVAPIDEQRKIVGILDEQLSRLDASLAVADVIEKKASAMRRSLLHSAFKGELTKEWREGAHV